LKNRISFNLSIGDTHHQRDYSAGDSMAGIPMAQAVYWAALAARLRFRMQYECRHAAVARLATAIRVRVGVTSDSVGLATLVVRSP
jgi:hypothetical protein